MKLSIGDYHEVPRTKWVLRHASQVYLDVFVRSYPKFKCTESILR